MKNNFLDFNIKILLINEIMALTKKRLYER